MLEGGVFEAVRGEENEREGRMMGRRRRNRQMGRLGRSIAEK